MEHNKVTSRKDLLIVLAFSAILAVTAVVAIVQSFFNDFPASTSTISEIVSDPTAWEGKTVRVYGTMQTTALGIIQPFNYWLYDLENQALRIGIKWLSDTNMSGESVTVVGVVKEGYAWVHPDYQGWWVHFIEATSVSEP